MEGAVLADYVDAYFRFSAEGRLNESKVYPAVEVITGSKPRTFERWATEHAGAFQ
jgi:hypothetical protein